MGKLKSFPGSQLQNSLNMEPYSPEQQLQLFRNDIIVESTLYKIYTPS